MFKISVSEAHTQRERKRGKEREREIFDINPLNIDSKINIFL